MANINGLATVNGGTLIPFENSTVEMLGPGHSTHLKRIVCAYANEGGVKVEVAYCPETGSVTVYRFKHAKDLQHYWSRSWEIKELIQNKKYANMINYLLRANQAIK